MCAKSRQLGLSFVVAALGVAVVLLSRPESFLGTISLGSSTRSTHVSSLLVLVAALGLFVIRWLDLGVYHRMLRGAAEFGECLERTHMRQLMGTPNGMTELISIYSRYKEVDRPGEGQREDKRERVVLGDGRTIGERDVISLDTANKLDQFDFESR